MCLLIKCSKHANCYDSYVLMSCVTCVHFSIDQNYMDCSLIALKIKMQSAKWSSDAQSWLRLLEI